MRKWFPSCTKIFTATACFWSDSLREQLHDRPNVYVLSECNQANPSVAGFGDLVHDMRVINSRNAPGGVAIFRSCDKAPVVLICVYLCLQACLCLPLPAAVHPLFSVAPCRAVRFRCPHWRQSQALVVGSKSFSFPGMVSFAVLVIREFRRVWILFWLTSLYLWACTFWLIILFLCLHECTYSDAPLDLKIKASMIADMFSLVGEFVLATIPIHLFSQVLHLRLIQIIQE